MDTDRQRAYRTVLSASALHMKWDLGCALGGLSWLPWRRREQMRSIERAAHRAFAFHNLAIFAARDFQGFREDCFWSDVDRFHAAFPESRWDYRALLDAVLRGDPFNVTSPPIREDRDAKP